MLAVLCSWTVAMESGNQGWRPHFGHGTVEEGLMRIGNIRKILQEVDSSTMDTVFLSK